jgi:hypothetical protein
MNATCKQCGGTKWFWHCIEGRGLATCLQCKTLTSIKDGKDTNPDEEPKQPKPSRAEDDPNNPRNSDGTFKDSGKYKSLRAIKTMRRRWRNGG